MARPFRLQPPDVDQALLRRELIKVLLDRFQARVTVVRAGAGFGKTTAVAQAVGQNRLASHGIDVWLGCEPGDADERNLRTGLGQALEVDGEPTLTAVLDAVASRTPAHLCVVLDDIHSIADGSTGALLLARLVSDLPANGHLLVTTRHHPPLALSRLEAQGRVRWVGERDLALDGTEIGALARAGSALAAGRGLHRRGGPPRPRRRAAPDPRGHVGRRRGRPGPAARADRSRRRSGAG